MTSGKVYLVGAGPGDPGLITVRGIEVLRAADVVIYDRLVNEALVDEAKPDAERVFAGASSRHSADRQTEINSMLVRYADEGKLVVRLKGGDPFVFGRGGEEAEVLASRGIDFEIVPGVTSAIAVPAYAGIPVTHRRMSSSFAVITGREDTGQEWSRVAWAELAKGLGTLVILMSVETLESVVAQLRNNGVRESMPVAVIEWGTLPRQRTVVGTLADIMGKVSDEALGPPAVTVVGHVVELRSHIAWFDRKPLVGMRVMVTRARAQAGSLSKRLEAEGAQPVEVASIEILPAPNSGAVDDAIKRLNQFDVVVFTSMNAVNYLFYRVEALAMDSRVFGGVKVVAIGPATAKTLRDRGIKADFMPTRYTAAALVEEMIDLEGKRLLLPRSAIAPQEFLGWLESRGAQVEAVQVYDTVVPHDTADRAREVLERRDVDAVTFTSSSAVNNLVDALGGDAADLLNPLLLASIGPVTTQTAEARGLRIALNAREHTVEGLVEELKTGVVSRREFG